MINKVIEAIQNEKVVSFVKSSFEESYKEFFKGHEKDVEKMLNKSFRLLKSNKKGFKRTINTINHEIFGKDDPEFWFNKMYYEYKTQIRPRIDLKRILPFFSGKSVLDFGCGAGFLSLELDKVGYSVSTADILQYRIPEAQHLPFYLINNSKKMPLPAKSIDVTIAKTVLHHISQRYQVGILKELERVTNKRLILEEDVFGLSLTIPEVKEKVKTQTLFNKFISMSLEDQFLCLVLKDYFANAAVFGHSDIRFPFAFKTLDQWGELLERSNFKLNKIIIEGFEKDKLTTNCQIWMICDVV